MSVLKNNYLFTGQETPISKLIPLKHRHNTDFSNFSKDRTVFKFYKSLTPLKSRLHQSQSVLRSKSEASSLTKSFSGLPTKVGLDSNNRGSIQSKFSLNYAKPPHKRFPPVNRMKPLQNRMVSTHTSSEKKYNLPKVDRFLKEWREANQIVYLRVEDFRYNH